MINKLFNGKPILVTGSHRSGSTWVGRMLSIPQRVRYIQEPFNLNEDYKNNPSKYWFEYVSESDTNARQFAYYHYINGFIGVPFKMISTDLISALFKGKVKSHLGIIKERLTRRYLIKDPIAVFSTEWLAKKFDMDVVVVIRHPAAFVASLKKQMWYHDFSHFTDQKRLMEEVLAEFEEEMNRIDNNKDDIIEHGILLWNLIHFQINAYQINHPNWHFVRHEDLSADPLETFEKLYGELKLDYTEETKKGILNHTQGQLKSDLRRNSAENIYAWKSILSDDEIVRVRNGTQEIAKLFYSEKEW